jgi:hypothetical protein
MLYPQKIKLFISDAMKAQILYKWLRITTDLLRIHITSLLNSQNYLDFQPITFRNEVANVIHTEGSLKVAKIGHLSKTALYWNSISFLFRI